MSTGMLLGLPIFLVFLLFSGVYRREESITRYKFVVEEIPITRLCSTKKILAVNGQYPGPTMHVRKGEILIVDIYNKATENITMHWHGVVQPRNPWYDGPEYITQCPIKPGEKFSQKIIFSVEEGTLWWHAHSDWARATVHGAVIIHPKIGTTYHFPEPDGEEIIILGEWWKQDVMEMIRETNRIGASPRISEANTINGQPGDLFSCSRPGMFRFSVDYGKTYMLRVINAAMNDVYFVAIANHNLTVVRSDATYIKPFTVDVISIQPGQTLDVLFIANQKLDHYYMAAKVYRNGFRFDNTTATAILEYNGNYTPSSPLLFPKLPNFRDKSASYGFFAKLKSLANKDHPIDVPMKVDKHLFYVISMNTIPCDANQTCEGYIPGKILESSINNISFQFPSIDILDAYYFDTSGVFGTNFPSFPPMFYDFTALHLSQSLELAKHVTEVQVLDYNTTVELVIQNTNLVRPSEHPMHLHGFNFYVLGWGDGIFDKEKDPLKYNLVDPPLQNNVFVPQKGWVTIRFRAQNPGVWLLHCHSERHAQKGMDAVFLVKNGVRPEQQMLPRPSNMPQC